MVLGLPLLRGLGVGASGSALPSAVSAGRSAMCSCAFSRSSLRPAGPCSVRRSWPPSCRGARLCCRGRRTVGGRRMTRTVADRMVESAGRGWVGREREIGALLAAATAEEPPFLVAFVHGPGGIGKSHLVRRLLDDLPAPVRGVYLDGRDVEPTPRGLRRALGQALGLADRRARRGALARALAARPTVLVIDTYEGLGLLDAWLRTQFLPALPATTLTVLAGRDRPAHGLAHQPRAGRASSPSSRWRRCPRTRRSELLRRRGLDERQARWAGEFAHGHPLALELAAAAVRADPRLHASAARWRPPACSKRSSGSSRRTTVTVVEAASTVRRVTEPVLAAMLDAPVGPRRLRRPARAAVHRADRRRAAAARRGPRHRRRRPGDARPRAPHAPTAAAPSRTSPSTGPVRPRDPGCTPPTSCSSSRTPCCATRASPASARRTGWSPPRRGTGPAIADIAARHESPGRRGAARRWWERHPETFSVARGPDGAVAAFVQIAELDRLDPALLADDPVAQVWRGAPARPPAAPPTTAYWSCAAGWAASRASCGRPPCRRAGWTSSASTCSCARGCAASTRSMVDLPRLAPIFIPLGFAPAGDPVMVDGVRTSPSGWTSAPGAWTAGSPGSSAPRPRRARRRPPSGR